MNVKERRITLDCSAEEFSLLYQSVIADLQERPKYKALILLEARMNEIAHTGIVIRIPPE